MSDSHGRRVRASWESAAVNRAGPDALAGPARPDRVSPQLSLTGSDPLSRKNAPPRSRRPGAKRPRHSAALADTGPKRPHRRDPLSREAAPHHATSTSRSRGTGVCRPAGNDVGIHWHHVTPIPPAKFHRSSKWWHPLPGAPVRFRVKGSHHSAISDLWRGSGLSTHALFCLLVR